MYPYKVESSLAFSRDLPLLWVFPWRTLISGVHLWKAFLTCNSSVSKEFSFALAKLSHGLLRWEALFLLADSSSMR